MMTRKENWVELLHEFVESRVSAPFAWQENDCCTFTADAVLAIAGTDLAADYRGQYTDQVSAFARIKEVTGGSTVEDVVVHAAQQFGMKELPTVLLAQRGDLVVFDGEDGPAVGIVYLNGIDALFVSPEGLKRQPLNKCRRAWGVR